MSLMLGSRRPWDEAGGSAYGAPQDATTGLVSATDSQGTTWYWNPSTNEWEQAHIIVEGDTLWDLTNAYYGAYNLQAVTAIHQVPQNLAIQGGDPNTGLIPGDVILIPNLPQPGITPPATGTPNTATNGGLTTNGQPGMAPSGNMGPDVGPNILPVTDVTGSTPAPEPFWTGPKIAVASVVAVGSIGTIAYLVMKPKRRNPSRRRRRHAHG
jgi:hypothetical protein